MPVSPGSIWNSVGSTKDLKPDRRSLEKCTAARDLSAPRAGYRGVEILKGLFSLELLIAHEECGG